MDFFMYYLYCIYLYDLLSDVSPECLNKCAGIPIMMQKIEQHGQLLSN